MFSYYALCVLFWLLRVQHAGCATVCVMQMLNLWLMFHYSILTATERELIVYVKSYNRLRYSVFVLIYVTVVYQLH